MVKRIVKIFNLRGLNNIDIIRNEKKVYLIEINPRPGLSSNIIDRVNRGPFINKRKNSNKKFCATKIVYAQKKININKKISNLLKKKFNSNKFSELPNEGDIIKVNQPICLIHLMENNKKSLKQKLFNLTVNFLDEIENNL